MEVLYDSNGLEGWRLHQNRAYIYTISLFVGGVSTNSSAEEIVTSIKAELEQRTKLIVDIFDYVNWVLSLTILLVVIKSYIYLRMYLKDDRHDNNYITDCFVKVDEKRLDKGK